MSNLSILYFTLGMLAGLPLGYGLGEALDMLWLAGSVLVRSWVAHRQLVTLIATWELQRR